MIKASHSILPKKIKSEDRRWVGSWETMMKWTFVIQQEKIKTSNIIHKKLRKIKWNYTVMIHCVLFNWIIHKYFYQTIVARHSFIQQHLASLTVGTKTVLMEAKSNIYIIHATSFKSFIGGYLLWFSVECWVFSVHVNDTSYYYTVYRLWIKKDAVLVFWIVVYDRRFSPNKKIQRIGWNQWMSADWLICIWCNFHFIQRLRALCRYKVPMTLAYICIANVSHRSMFYALYNSV